MTNVKRYSGFFFPFFKTADLAKMAIFRGLQRETPAGRRISSYLSSKFVIESVCFPVSLCFNCDIPMTKRITSLLVLAGLVSFGSNAADWPQWRGPNRDGVSKETGLLKTWPTEGPKAIWENREVGHGYGAPAVAGDGVYLISNEGVEDESVVALKAADGKKSWSTRIGAVGNPKQQPSYPASRSMPAVDGNVLFALGSDGDLAAIETKTGAIQWQKSARKDFGGEPGRWAYSESPLVDGDLVVFGPGNGVALAALNKKSGEVVWKTEAPDLGQAAYASPIIVTVGGVKQYVELTEKAMIGVEAKSGKLLWRYEHAAKGSPAYIPTPVAKDNMIFTASARSGGATVKVKAEGGAFSVEELFFDAKMPNAIGGSVLVGDTLYGTAAGGLMAIDFATGKLKWQERAIGPASLLYADGRLYLHGEEGAVAMVEASPEGYHEKGKFTPGNIPARPNNGKAWSYPALANGRLYIRDGTALWCYEVK